MAPYFVPQVLEPELSVVGREQLELRLQEWQAQQDLSKWKKTQHRLHQRNLELKEELNQIYQEEQRHEQHHMEELRHFTKSTAAAPQLDQCPSPLSPVISQSLPFPPIPGITCPQLQPVSSVTSVPIVQPLQCSSNPVRSQLQPSSAVSVVQPLQSSPNLVRSQVQPASPVPMIVLPILPIPEQFQSYTQYLEAFSFWCRWHCATDPNSLGLFHIYQTMS